MSFPDRAHLLRNRDLIAQATGVVVRGPERSKTAILNIDGHHIDEQSQFFPMFTPGAPIIVTGVHPG